MFAGVDKKQRLEVARRELKRMAWGIASTIFRVR
jgi:hypothetical protein